MFPSRAVFSRAVFSRAVFSRAVFSRAVVCLLAVALTLAACTVDSESPSDPLAFEPSVNASEPVVTSPSSTIPPVLLSPECDLAGLTVPEAHAGSWAPAPDQVDGLNRLAYTEGTDLVLNTVGGPAPFVAGVNIGPTIPGFQPGEVAIRREDFNRWFPLMAQSGFRAIRVYSIQPPSFYEELLDYNQANPDSPLYVIHGVWIPEERFITERDLFAPGLQQEFFDEITRTMDVVFGEADLPERPGHASGVFTADISPWTYAWVLGIEWDPVATRDNDAFNEGREPFVGDYFRSTDDASPTEVWIAGSVDHAARQLADRGVAVPLAFANWPTTDPLVHPDEPLYSEDLVGVDANHVVPTSWSAGTFASYHAYPYYPDFQRYEPGIADCELRGQPDNYAGYLAKLRQHHPDMPVMITEFGVPSSWAQAHSGPQGRDQGDHSEQQAMQINADMMDMIHDLGFAGGYVFEWADEWFKFTWNTIDYELPRGRRQLWMNPWTNEAHFGVLAVDPGSELTTVIDGSKSEWELNGSQVVGEHDGAVREVRAVVDEGYLYLGITLDQTDSLESGPLTIGFDVLPEGGGGLPGTDGQFPEADYAVVIDPNAESQVLVAGHADAFTRTYGLLRDYFEVDPASVEPGAGSWRPHQLITNRPQVIPTTNEEFGFEVFNAGLLRRGSSQPDSVDFDSRSAWELTDGFLEMRIPFMAIGISDPSQRQAFVVNNIGEVRTEPFDRVEFELSLGGNVITTGGYSWEPWQLPTWHERLKAGIDVLAATNRNVMGD